MQIIESFSPELVHNIQLVVEQSARQFVVKAGTFKHAGIDYTVNDDVEIDIEERGSNCAVNAWLCKEKASGAIAMIVTEDCNGDIPTDFTAEDYPYETLHLVFIVDVPAGPAPIDDLDTLVFIIRPGMPEDTPNV
jgi:hypothetical protein